MADDNEGFLIHINGKSYDVADLTLNEAADVEDLCGGSSMDQLQFGSATTRRSRWSRWGRRSSSGRSSASNPTTPSRHRW